MCGALLGAALLAPPLFAEIWVCPQQFGPDLYSDQNLTGDCQPFTGEPLQHGVVKSPKSPKPADDDEDLLAEKPEKAEASEKAEKPEKAEKAERAEKPARKGEKGETARSEKTSEPGKPARHEVKFEPYEGSAKRIIILVKFNDSVTARMIIDTGAPGMVISEKLAERLGVFESDEGTLLIQTGGIGGTVPAVRTIIDKVSIGKVWDRFVPTTVVEKSISGAFEGLIGMDFTSKYSMHVDSKRKVVIFDELPPDENAPGGRDEQWWRTTFREFNSYREAWMEYGEELDKKIRDNSTGKISDTAELQKLRKAAGWQYQQADKLLNRLDRYANEHFVPRYWRQ